MTDTWDIIQELLNQKIRELSTGEHPYRHSLFLSIKECLDIWRREQPDYPPTYISHEHWEMYVERKWINGDNAEKTVEFGFFEDYTEFTLFNECRVIEMYDVENEEQLILALKTLIL